MPRSPEEILSDAGIPFVVHDHDPVATVTEIVAALPFSAEDHVKTLAFTADTRVVLAALRGSDRIAKLSPTRVRDGLGLEPGGVCPLVDRDDVTVLVDRRVLDRPRAFCGSGRNDATLELAPADLVAASRAAVADLTAD